MARSDSKGKQRRLTFRNVRHVPGFRYTLLSVQQLWQEQRIDARFADDNALVVHTPGGKVYIPSSSSASLPVVDLMSYSALPSSAASTGAGKQLRTDDSEG